MSILSEMVGDPLGYASYIWTTLDGRELAWSEMTDAHLGNATAMLWRLSDYWDGHKNSAARFDGYGAGQAMREAADRSHDAMTVARAMSAYRDARQRVAA